MIVHDVQQGSMDWLNLRLGIPTASCFHRIITEKTMKLSAQSDGYIADLCTEFLLQEPIDSASSGFMERGIEFEDRARAYLAFDQDVEVTKVGFVTTDNGKIGGSPDCLVGDDAIGEIKILEASNHIAALLKPNLFEHRPQIQGNLWITDRSHCLRLYWHPTLPSLVVRIDRDEEFIAALSTAMTDFLVNLEIAKTKLVRLGCRCISPRGTHCKGRLDDGRFCFVRIGLNEQGFCERHANDGQ